MITWKKSVVIFFSKNFLGSDIFGARKNGSDFLALFKKFENPCLNFKNSAEICNDFVKPPYQW